MSHHNNQYPPPNPGAYVPGYANMQPVQTTGYSSHPGYPPSQPGYPPSQPGYPSAQPGYPPSQPGYPSAQPGYPSSQPGYPSAQPGYPPSQPGYPSAQPGYPPSQPGYPPSQPGYPSAQPGYLPSQPGYPPSQPGYHPSQPGYPSAQPGYPPSQPGYPPSQPGYPSNYPAVPPPSSGLANSFSEMKLHSDHNLTKATPTVLPSSNFDAVADAKILRKAMKGFGTDEAALIDVICRRSNVQRLAIAQAFKVSYGKDLIEDIKSETTGNFENLLVALLTPTIDFYVKEIHNAMDGMGTAEDVLIEVFCSLKNHEIHTIKAAYKRLYGADLESELMSETSGNFKRLLVSLCAGGRDESGQTNLEAARQDAKALLQAGVLRVGTDESVFNMVLCQRNYQQIKLICDEYQKIASCSLKDSIRKEFSGDIEDGLVAIVKCTSNKAEFFASQLKKSMEGAGSNDRDLIRLMVTRCEIDLGDIKVAFEKKYGKTLRSYVSGDTSGDYKYGLYALMGEKRSS